MNSGIPLGGIGAGSVEIRDDGLFREWQIFGNWRGDELRLTIDGACFTFDVVPQRGEAVVSRVLATRPSENHKPVDGIRYTGHFPFAELEYQIDDSPCRVKLTAWSPFIPHHTKDSALPAAIFDFDITNTSDTDYEVHVAGRLWNEPGGASEPRVSSIEQVNGKRCRSTVIHCEGSPEHGRGNGTMAFAVPGEKEHTGWSPLKAGESRRDTFVLTWHFPDFIDAEGIDIGRMYSNWFSSAAEVADYVAENLDSLRRRTSAFRDVLYRSTLPRWLADAVNAQLTTLFKTSWWTREGNFAIWEGMACCGMQTTDVAYYGSFPLIMLFPDLAKQAMRLSARFQNPSGRIPHFFPGTFQYPDAYHMIDLMPKFTLMVWRDYLWTGDRAYLDEMWPHVRAAMEHNRALDRNGDFICDDHGIDQTYDGWEMEGASVYVGLINAAGLKAASEMARLQGEDDLADQYERLATIGAASLDRLLWNGEYYDLFYDLGSGKREECCMSDQVNGAWYARMLELGEFVPGERVKSALNSILRYNRGSDCIHNGGWRQGGPTEGGQWSASWSGTEYMLASHMIYEGMVEQGISTAKTVYDRFAKMGRTWDHWECGDHYYRAMVVHTILMALQGFHYSAIEGKLAIDPRAARENHISPLITPLGWGEVTFSDTGAGTSLKIQLMSGELSLNRLEIGSKHAKLVEATLDGKPVSADARAAGDQVSLVLSSECHLLAGSELRIALA